MCGQVGIIVGTYNGTIYNADYLFRRLGLPRYAEVDSELLFRLADRFAPNGTIDGRGFRKALCLCRGQMSAVLASLLDSGAITVLKGKWRSHILNATLWPAVAALQPQTPGSALCLGSGIHRSRSG